MKLEKELSTDKSTVTIRVRGMFDLSIQNEFRSAYESDRVISNYIIDMQETEYVDSTAFGMLLLFRDYAGGDESNIVINNANSDIKKSFSMLQFERMFNIT